MSVISESQPGQIESQMLHQIRQFMQTHPAIFTEKLELLREQPSAPDAISALITSSKKSG
jgi:hypothetical protein